MCILQHRSNGDIFRITVPPMQNTIYTWKWQSVAVCQSADDRKTKTDILKKAAMNDSQDTDTIDHRTNDRQKKIPRKTPKKEFNSRSSLLCYGN